MGKFPDRSNGAASIDAEGRMTTAVRTAKSRLRPAVKAYRRSAFRWRFVDNLWPSVAYRLTPHHLDPIAHDLLDQLDRDGVAMTTLERFCAGTDLGREL